MNEDRRTTLSTGFTYGGNSHVIEVVNQISTANSETEGRHSLLSLSERKNHQIQQLIRKASSAYLVDGLVRQVVDKCTEQFKDFTLQGGDRQVAYLYSRLNQISVRTGEWWKTTFKRSINAYFKTGNTYVTKLRGTVPGAVRPLYANKPAAICGLRLVSADRLMPKIDMAGNVLGWTSVEYGTPGLIVGNNSGGTINTPGVLKVDEPNLPRGRALVELPEPESDLQLFLPGLDFMHMAYMKPEDSALGVGMTFAGLEDIALLRTLESNTAIMIKKYSTPLLHHKILGRAGPGSNLQSEIDRITLLHQRKAPDGVVVTGENHEIKSLGAESMALRLEGYLDFYAARACVGIGANADVMGLRPTKIAITSNAADAMMDKIRACQKQMAWDFEFFLLWELLWEGGFDPFNKEEDRVTLEFTDLDEEGTRALQTHAGDLFQKNVIDHPTAMKMGKFPSPKPVEREMHFTKYQKPLKADKPTPPKKKTKSKNSRESLKSFEQFSQELTEVRPESVEDCESCLYLLSRLYDYDEHKLLRVQDTFQALYTDWPAACELLYQTLYTEFK